MGFWFWMDFERCGMEMREKLYGVVHAALECNWAMESIINPKTVAKLLWESGCVAADFRPGGTVYVLNEKSGKIHENTVVSICINGEDDRQNFYKVRYWDHAGKEKIRQYTFPSVGKILFRTKEAAEEAWNALAAAEKKK